jgi:hypothetical protein
MPAHRKGLAPIQHPRPIHSLIKLGSQLLDLRIFKISPRRQNPAKQQRTVDRRELRPGEALSRLHIGKVIEEPVHLGEMIQVPAQRCSHTFHDLRVRQIAAMIGNAECGQAEPGRCGARHSPGVARALGADRCEPRSEESALKIVKESFVFWLDLPDSQKEQGQPTACRLQHLSSTALVLNIAPPCCSMRAVT